MATVAIKLPDSKHKRLRLPARVQGASLNKLEKRWRAIVAILVIQSFGCGECVSRWRFADGRYIPSQWSKAVEPLGESSLQHRLDANTLYVADEGSLPPGIAVQWFRFWPNGRALEKAVFDFQSDEVRSEGVPSAKNADDFRHSSASYYSVKNGYITIESIGPSENLFVCTMTYFRYTGVLNPDGSFTLATPAKNEATVIPDRAPRTYVTFRPVKVEGMQRGPDW